MVDTPRENTSTLKACKDFCKSHPDLEVLKVRGDAHKMGYSDLIGCVYDRALGVGRFFSIEVKRPGIKEASPLQAVKLGGWKKVKGIAGVADTLDAFKRIFADHGVNLL